MERITQKACEEILTDAQWKEMEKKRLEIYRDFMSSQKEDDQKVSEESKDQIKEPEAKQEKQEPKEVVIEEKKVEEPEGQKEQVL